MLKPLHDYILIKPTDIPNLTTGGLYLPDTVKGQPDMGTVTAVGPGKYDDKGNRESIEIEPGETVFYAKYSGMVISHNDEQFILIQANAVMAKHNTIKHGDAE